MVTLYQLPILQVFLAGGRRISVQRINFQTSTSCSSLHPASSLPFALTDQVGDNFPGISVGSHALLPLHFWPTSLFEGLSFSFWSSRSFGDRFLSASGNFSVWEGFPRCEQSVWLRCFCVEGFPQTATDFGPKKRLATSSLASCDIFSDQWYWSNINISQITQIKFTET